MKHLSVLVVLILSACGVQQSSQLGSLTDPSYQGHKYYFGWGDAGGSPSSMQNEVKYDVLHTHDIFTTGVGGDYEGKKLVGTVSSSSIKAYWNELAGKMKPDDMYLQYSSGHGSDTGLGVGVSYDQIRDNALAYPAREIVIFTMACLSGNLVDSFNEKRSVWQDWPLEGRSLLVMSSSRADENSSTGPGTDPDQPNSPNGSAGSAFGHALWKALIGYADGYPNGFKDGFLSLGEIIDFTVWKTRQVGGHTPTFTGIYDRNLVMAKVPPHEWVERLEKSTEGLSDEEIMLKIHELDSGLDNR